jgi:hypothetical protein
MDTLLELGFELKYPKLQFLSIGYDVGDAFELVLRQDLCTG